ncbi:MAG: hypothetical protein R3A12_03040 [Ignavibacteria bacterium]
MKNSAGFAKSTNGGVNWIVNENIYAMNGVKTSSLSPCRISVSTDILI